MNSPTQWSERVYLVNLTPTPSRHEHPEDFARVVPDHLAWVAEQQTRGVLLATGPVVDDLTGENTGEGVFLVRLDSTRAVADLVAQDPQVVAGFKTPTIRCWAMRALFRP